MILRSRLFTKIFLLFWLAMTLAGVVLLTLEGRRTEKLTERWRGITGDAFAIYAESAAAAVENDVSTPRKMELNEYLTGLTQRARIRARLYNANGNPVAGYLQSQSLVSPWMAQYMKRLANRALQSGQTEFEPLNGNVLAARVATSPKGRRFVLVGNLPSAHYGLWVPEPRVHALRFIAVLAIAALVSWLLAHHLIVPIIRLSEVVRKLAQGELSARAGEEIVKRKDELGDLAHDFDDMASRIENLLHEQQQLMVAQRRLLGDVAHELRSPLARVAVVLELGRDALDGSRDSRVLGEGQTFTAEEITEQNTLCFDSVYKSLNRIERETGRLGELINLLLILSRLESGVQQPEQNPIDLASLVKSVVADATFEVHANKHIQISLLNCDHCVVYGIQDLLRSAVENIVRNAMRHTAEGTAVEVGLWQEVDEQKDDHRWNREGLHEGCYSSPAPRIAAPSGWIVFRVRDHGPGVPENELEKIFRPFYRVGGGRDRQTGGAGLGLAITTRAVELHGGQWRACNAQGGGLVVELRLPTHHH